MTTAPAPSPPAPARPPGGASRRRLIAAFSDHLPLKAAALFLAVILWFVVNVKEPQVQLVRVRFVPVLDSSLVLRDPPPEVQALVAGSPRDLLQLSSGPLVIRRQITADAPDTLVIDLQPSDVTLPEGVDAVVRNILPRSITLRFESTWTRRVPVQSAVELASSAWPVPVTVQLEPDSVQVSGPRHVVSGVSFVRTVRAAIGAPDSLPHLVDIDTTRLGVRVRPSQVKVKLVPVPRP
jgi:YbbR domain-containing protein